MKLKFILSAAVLLTTNGLFAQTTPPANPFEVYGNQQSQLIQKAYEARDGETGMKLMNEFTVKYNELTPADKRIYKGFVTNNYYNLSCLYSLINNKPKAFEYLDSAVNNGYINYSHLMEDTDFANIKNEPKFKQVAQSLRGVADYKYILQKAEKFNPNDKRVVPAFSYQPATDPNLVAIRKNFKLDEIAGNGNDASKAINILKWVHNTVQHDGQHESGIQLINANEIISKATSKKIGVSCGELATTLNECYLAMGWKSRKVYCFPKDSLNVDYDSHVINVVYLPSLSKWVWMDPTNNAYVMDENKNLLGIAEVRERIIKNQPLFVNDDANWNNREKITKEFYLDNYMAKNLYRVYSPQRNEYNYETRDKDKTITYISLLPLEYFKQSPDKSEDKNKETNFTIERYRTNNADAFWKVSAGQ
ncbi:MAG: transglutaminase domain-containing protein [Bacteroidota bacterium]